MREEHEQAKAALDRSTGLHDFKKWLTKAHRGDFSPSAVRRAAELVTDAPEEFNRLGLTLRELSGRPVS